MGVCGVLQHSDCIGSRPGVSLSLVWDMDPACCSRQTMYVSMLAASSSNDDDDNNNHYNNNNHQLHRHQLGTGLPFNCQTSESVWPNSGQMQIDGAHGTGGSSRRLSNWRRCSTRTKLHPTADSKLASYALGKLFSVSFRQAKLGNSSRIFGRLKLLLSTTTGALQQVSPPAVSPKSCQWHFTPT